MKKNKNLMEFLIAHKSLLFILSLVFAVGLLGIQALSSKVNDAESEKDKEALKQQIDSLQKDNTELLSKIALLQNDTAFLQQIGRTQLNATFYTKELDHDIPELNLLIRFNKGTEPTSIFPYQVYIEIGQPGESVDGNPLFYINGSGNADSSSYTVLLNEKGSNDNYISMTRLQAHRNGIVDSIFLRMKLYKKMILRDLHTKRIEILMPEHLIENVATFELIVNGYAILEINPSDYLWHNYKFKTVLSEDDIDNLKFANIKDPDEQYSCPMLWEINLYNNLPKKYNY